jgi:modification methylase
MDKLFRGDCLAVLPSLPPSSVQAIITSPPYNIGFDYADGGAGDQLPLGRYLGLLRRFFRLALPLLHEGGALCVNLPPTIRTPDYRAYPLAAWAQMELLAQGYLPSEPVAWVKSRDGSPPMASSTAIGAPSNPYLRPTHELVLVARKGSYKVAGKATEWGFPAYLEVLKDTWTLPPARVRRGDPPEFPAQLVANLVHLYSAPGDVILDPFAGTGQTARVAKLLDRTAWLIERQPAYWDRLEAIVHQAAIPMEVPS